MNNYETYLYAFLGGIIPALIWLAYWLREDAQRPEPKRLIVRTFLFGMVSVVLVLPFQIVIDQAFPGKIALAFLLWAVFEEVFKYASAYAGGLSTKDDDEPLDPVIYMITAALGFVALENMLFIFGSLELGAASGWITGNLRFIGSGLLHTVSSATVGIALALSFYKRFFVRFLWGTIGLAVAILIHTAFNLLLLHEHELSSLLAFSGVWAGVAIVLLLFEKVKTIRRRARPDTGDN